MRELQGVKNERLTDLLLEEGLLNADEILAAVGPPAGSGRRLGDRSRRDRRDAALDRADRLRQEQPRAAARLVPGRRPARRRRRSARRSVPSTICICSSTARSSSSCWRGSRVILNAINIAYDRGVDLDRSAGGGGPRRPRLPRHRDLPRAEGSARFLGRRPDHPARELAACSTRSRSGRATSTSSPSSTRCASASASTTCSTSR